MARRAVHQLELLSRPPDTRTPTNPWPLWPNIFRVSSAHEEGALDDFRNCSSVRYGSGRRYVVDAA